jgi:phosphoserine phosphatase
MSATGFRPGEFPLLIARLIADPASLQTRLDALTAALEGEGMRLAEAQMLEFCGDVLELELPEGDPKRFAALIDAHFAPADWLIHTDEIRVPEVFVSDMDSTMIGQECIDELADFAGIREQISAITERAMRGELEFESALRERVGLLKGLGIGAIEECLTARITPMPGARTLVATLKHRGCKTVLVTGGFHHFADPVAANIGFERVISNRLAVEDAELSGELEGEILDSNGKERVLREEMALLGDNAVSLATGDGANDIPMLEAATYGVAYRGKPKARAAANGVVERGDLTAILKLLDIPESDWVR